MSRLSPSSVTAGVWRRASVLIVVALSAFAATLAGGVADGAGCATPFQSQGGYFRGVGFDNGTRSYIQGSGSNNSCGVVAFFVAEQSHPPTDSTDPIDMIQAGEIKEDYNFGTGNDCNTDGTLGKVAVIREYVSPSNGIDYTCNIYETISRDAFGNGNLYASALGSNGWEAFFNSNPIGSPQSVNLGFSSGFSVARAEALWSNAAPTYDMTWGPNGQVQWQYKTNSSGCCTSYTNVPSSAHTYGQSDGWTVGNPTNFHVTR